MNTKTLMSPVLAEGHLFVEGLLLVVIVFLLSQKSYKPPKRPLTKKVLSTVVDLRFGFSLLNHFITTFLCVSVLFDVL